jgi:hypothetical protein
LTFFSFCLEVSFIQGSSTISLNRTGSDCVMGGAATNKIGRKWQIINQVCFSVHFCLMFSNLLSFRLQKLKT